VIAGDGIGVGAQESWIKGTAAETARFCQRNGPTAEDVLTAPAATIRADEAGRFFDLASSLLLGLTISALGSPGQAAAPMGFAQAMGRLRGDGGEELLTAGTPVLIGFRFDQRHFLGLPQSRIDWS